jgi:hypothetical protein
LIIFKKKVIRYSGIQVLSDRVQLAEWTREEATNGQTITSVSVRFKSVSIIHNASDMVTQRYQKNFSREIVWRCLDLTITRLTQNLKNNSQNQIKNKQALSGWHFLVTLANSAHIQLVVLTCHTQWNPQQSLLTALVNTTKFKLLRNNNKNTI